MLEIKPLTIEQLSAAVELDKLCFGGLWTLEGYRQELINPSSEMWGMSLPAVNQSQSEILIGIGCFWAILDEAHITLLGIHPQYRRQGLGEQMLKALLGIARQRGIERATLEVKSSNQAALSLYEKLNFKIAGRRKGYYQDTGEDALILWRNAIQNI